jgi:hypothetical protein
MHLPFYSNLFNAAISFGQICHHHTTIHCFVLMDVKFLSCFPLVHPIILGIDQPTIELTMIPYNRIQYSGSIGDSISLKIV